MAEKSGDAAASSASFGGSGGPRGGEIATGQSGDTADGASGDVESHGSCPSSSYGKEIVDSRAWKACAPPARWAPCVYPAMKNGALEPQNMEVTANSGGVTGNNDDQVYDLLRSMQKRRRDILRKEHVLQEQSAQCDMDIQTTLNERKLTPKVLSLIDTYKEPCSNMLEITNSSYTGNGVETMSIERKTLREALHIRSKCQELDEICFESNWMLPRYTIEPSVADGKFRAIVNLKSPDFEISITGSPRLTPCDAKRSAALKMIIEIHRKAEEEEEQEN